MRFSVEINFTRVSCALFMPALYVLSINDNIEELVLERLDDNDELQHVPLIPHHEHAKIYVLMDNINDRLSDMHLYRTGELDETCAVLIQELRGMQDTIVRSVMKSILAHEMPVTSDDTKE